MTDSYITVSVNSCEEFIVNKSRFIGYAAPCMTEKEALDFLQSCRDNHKTATHHCYAYVIGDNSSIMRYSDDGEPGGTAGLPIMDVLRTGAVVNCCIVVVRYFGGTLLGTGGLVRAYTQAAQAALKASRIVRMEKTTVFHCELPYSQWDRFRYTAEHLPVRVENIQYGSSVCFQLSVRTRECEMYLSRLTDASERTLKQLSSDESYKAWDITV